MNKKYKINTKVKALTILLAILMTGVYMNFLPKYSDIFSNSKIENDESDQINNPDKPLKVGIYKFDQWWNKSYAYRALINVTNPYDVNLTDTWTSIQFNYENLVSAGKMNASIKDVRIIEIINGIETEREYYIEMNYPIADYVTVYFRTNCENNTLEMDTYLYYGNNSVDYGSKLVSYDPRGINWYRFEEGSGSNAANELGQYDGTLVNMEESDWKTPGVNDPYQLGDYYLEMEGGGGGSRNEYIYINDQYFNRDVTGYLDSLTVCVWFKTSYSNPSEFQNWALFDFDRSEWFDLWISATTGQICFSTAAETRDMQDFYSSTPDLNDGDWHFAMAQFNTTNKIIYIDEDMETYDNIQVSPHNNLPLGRHDSGDYNRYGFMGDGSEADTENGARNNYYYEGGLDEVRYLTWSLDRYEREQVYYQYELTAELNEESANTANIKVTARGLDGEYIPGVAITLNQTSGGSYIKRQTADALGTTTFTDLGVTPVYYNFTVTMDSSIYPALQETINISAPIQFRDFYQEIDIICNVSTVEFDIDDVDGKPVESGWVIVGNQTGQYTQIQNCTIIENGGARFWWLDDQVYSYDYNYTVWYHQPDYYPDDLELNKIVLATGTIKPDDLQTLDTIYINTNLTTVIFDVRKRDEETTVIEGAVLQLYENTDLATQRLVCNLVSDENGNATLRWVNSSTQLGYSDNRNYTLKIDFWGIKDFKIPVIKDVYSSSLSFEVIDAANYTVVLTANPDNYAMEIISLNPTNNLFIDWGTQVSIRYLLNRTLYEGNPSVGTIPIDADSMVYTAKFGTISVSGTLDVEIAGSGRHVGIIDTSKLDIVLGSQTTYTITITAQEPGFQSVENTDLTITVIKNDAYINETYNDESVKSNYWLEDINMTIQPYGENSEYLLLEYEIFQESNDFQRFDIDFSIPDLSIEWNLSQIEFNIYNVEHGNLADIQLNITSPEGMKYTWDENNVSNYQWYGASATNGTWIDLIIDPTNDFQALDNNYIFIIDGNFTGNVDIVGTAYFIRNKINTGYSLFNVSDYIIIPSDGNGWVIKNITFELFNCRDPSNWSPILDPRTAIERITYEGFNYTVDSLGKLTIDNMTIYPTNDRFLFDIIEISDIMFDLNITIEYIQGFYWNPNLENVSVTFTANDFTGGDFIINYNDDDLNNLENVLLITNIHNGTPGLTFSPIDLAMNITIVLPGGDITYNIGELGTLSLSGFSTNLLYSAYIETLEPVNFTLTFLSTNLRIVNYRISGTMEFEATPTYKGTVSYDDNLETYLLTLDTSLLNAQLYTIVFTFSSNTYETAIKNMNIEVLERETLMNGQPSGYSTVTRIDVQTERIFTFTYVDEDLGTFIYDLDDQYYEWQLKQGDTIIDIGQGDLTFGSNQYILDFKTKGRRIGTYLLFPKLSKQNYELQTGFITLVIEEREIDYDLGDMFDDKKASVVKGKEITLEIELTDITTGLPLKGAKVILDIGDEEFEFDEVEDGLYEYDFDTEEYEAFFTSNTLTGTIKISKANYTTEEVDIVIVVEMEEVVEGVPIFYFIMIAGAIAAVVGSLVTYRFIQIARIPKFVKKARAMKKAIKGKKDILESALTKSKEEFIFNEFGDEWEEIGLSLKYVLGINGKKGKSIGESDKLSKNKGGAE